MIRDKIATALAFSENAAENMIKSYGDNIPDDKKVFIKVFNDILSGLRTLIETKHFTTEEANEIITFASGGTGMSEIKSKFGLTTNQALAFSAKAKGDSNPLIKLFTTTSEGVSKSTHMIGVKFLEQIIDKMRNAENPNEEEIKEYETAVKFLNELLTSLNDDSSEADINSKIAELYSEFNDKELIIEVE